MAPTIVQFAPLPSQTHPSFWHKLTEFKLDVLKLSDAEVDIIGSYGPGKLIKDREGGAYVGVTGSLSVEEESFGQGHVPSIANVAAKGIVKNYNTIEEFKAADKTKLFNEAADKIWSSIQTSKSTSLLNSFLLITFADLKKYKYFYWFAFPAFVSTPAWHIDSDTGFLSVSAPNSGLSHTQLVSIHKQLSKSLPYFLVKSTDPEQATIVGVEEYTTDSSSIIGFIDPSAQAQNPGWPLRNLLAYIRALHPNITSCKVLCWRDTEVAKEVSDWKSRIGVLTVGDGSPIEAKDTSTRPNAVGWEKNAQGKLAPKMADLAPMMDPVRLANQAVDLNLKLMRWRILPSLDLDRIAATKCLLLGAGTLGCYVARCLMA
ncbi:Autophagy protein 7 [Stygiomarasmius scandens]|uniref:Autophagy protein 7 n=1 Tax=Marasmiellus scandens TaxID=2682957 RepID=A0ABR1K338_9AGAR